MGYNFETSNLLGFVLFCPSFFDTEMSIQLLLALQAFHEDLMAEEVNVQSAIKKGQVIARFCHPSALQIIQQWIARLKKRWDEVTVSITDYI